MTVEVLKTAMPGLNDEQYTKLAELAANHAQDLVDRRTAEIHTAYDNDIKAITGQEKPAGVKTFDHLKTVLGDAWGKAGSYKTLEQQVSALAAEKSQLEEQLKSGKGAEALTAKIGELEKKIADKDSEVQALKTGYSKKEQEYQDKMKELAQQMLSVELEKEFNATLAQKQVKFKPAIPETVLKDALEVRKRNALKDLIIEKDEASGQLIVRNKQGEIKRNEQFAPVTPGELFFSAIGDLVEESKPGGGTGSGGFGGGAGGEFSMTGITTQVQAVEAIKKYLTSKGLTSLSSDFAKEQAELFQKHEINKLPMR